MKAERLRYDKICYFSHWKLWNSERQGLWAHDHLMQPGRADHEKLFSVEFAGHSFEDPESSKLENSVGKNKGFSRLVVEVVVQHV